MSSEWKNWCRLCGCKNNSEIDVFIKDENFFSLSEAIQRFLAITICDVDEAPKKICIKCQTLLSDLVTFSMKATKVQEMYSELQFNDKFEMFTNFEQLREKYGLSIEQIDYTINRTNNITEICERHSYNDDNEENDDDDDQQPQSTKRKKRKRNTKTIIKSEEIYPSSDDLSDNDYEKNDFDESLRKVFDSVNQEINVNVEIKEEQQSSIIAIRKPRKKREIKTKSLSKEYKIFCEVCNKGFANQGGYKWHLKLVHQIVKEPESFPCKICGKIFKKSAQLKIHDNSHLPPDQRKWYSCPHCDKKFTVESSVGNHIRTVHIKEKCFICEECGKSFVTNDALNSHKLVHTDECPFQCPKCSKCFKRLPSLKNHLDSHDDTKYICPVCGLQLNTKTTLRRHMVIHSDEKKYKCNFCGNQFKRSKALKNHLILHTGLKPYECPFCEQTFANGSNCRKHQKNSHTIELAAMEDAGEKKICKNVPRLEHLKAVNNAALCGLDIDTNQKFVGKMTVDGLNDIIGNNSGATSLTRLEQISKIQKNDLQVNQIQDIVTTATITTTPITKYEVN